MPTFTTKRWGASLAGAAATAAILALIPTPAQAATWTCSTGGHPIPAGVSCTTSYASGAKVTVIKSGTGTTLRAVFYDSQIRYSGDRIMYYGSDNCSATTTDTDFKLSFMPDGWDNKISSVEDYHGCDVNLFWDEDWNGSSTGYTNYSDQNAGGGRHLGITWSNDASSFKIS